MVSKKEFWQWFKSEVQGRWPRHHFEWTQIDGWRSGNENRLGIESVHQLISGVSLSSRLMRSRIHWSPVAPCQFSSPYHQKRTRPFLSTR